MFYLQLDSNKGKRPVWLNGWVFAHELSGSGFESSCSHLNFRFRACFEQGVPWHSGNYRVWIHSETRTWHDKNMQSNVLSYRKIQIKMCLSIYGITTSKYSRETSMITVKYKKKYELRTKRTVFKSLPIRHTPSP